MGKNLNAEVVAIKEVLKQYAVACNTGDFDLWISLWSDEIEVVQMPPDSPARIGKTAVSDAVKSFFDTLKMEMKIIKIEDAKVYGDLGLTHCNYTMALTPKAGGKTIVAAPDSKALTIYKRQSDGSWKIYYDCFNSNVPRTA
jgi:uncharacterized protein (TIGR02246 family)